jgi:hypothetical protein
MLITATNMKKTFPKWKGFFMPDYALGIMFLFKVLYISYLIDLSFLWYKSWLLACKIITIMTILLFLILVLLCWATYKSINWFEKI